MLLVVKGEGNGLSQLANPRGVIIDHFGTVYVADYDNHRIMRWYTGAVVDQDNDRVQRFDIDRS